MTHYLLLEEKDFVSITENPHMLFQVSAKYISDTELSKKLEKKITSKNITAELTKSGYVVFAQV